MSATGRLPATPCPLYFRTMVVNSLPFMFNIYSCLCSFLACHRTAIPSLKAKFHLELGPHEITDQNSIHRAKEGLQACAVGAVIAIDSVSHGEVDCVPRNYRDRAGKGLSTRAPIPNNISGKELGTVMQNGDIRGTLRRGKGPCVLRA